MGGLVTYTISYPLYLNKSLKKICMVPQHHVKSLFKKDSLLYAIILSTFTISFRERSVILILPAIKETLSYLSA